MKAALYALYEALNAAYDLDEDYLTAAALQALCGEAVTGQVPAEEATWHAHQLRRLLVAQYRATGYALHEGAYSVAGLLDVVTELAAEQAAS